MVNLMDAFKVAADADGSRPPKETVNARVIALALFGALSAVMYGYDTGMRFSYDPLAPANKPGFIGGVITLPGFITDFDLATKSAAYVTDYSSNVVATFQVRLSSRVAYANYTPC